ncbi:prevent-host-death family protein [delta proteobacterium NaphS2]|nr:prevent-host-death family protein [delta proteobacterium NaphS2]
MRVLRFVGILLLLMGAVGLIACALALFKTGSAGTELRKFVVKTFDSVENGIEDIRDQANQIALSLAHARGDLEIVLSKVNSLQKDEIEKKSLPDQVVIATDSDIRDKLARARRSISSAENVAFVLGRLLTTLDASGLFYDEAHRERTSLPVRFEKTAGILRQLSDTLDEATETVLDFQNHPDAKPVHEKLSRELARMEKGLSELQSVESDFSEAVQKIENRLLQYEERAIRWIQLGNILIPLIIIWIGVGEAALIILGGRLCFK